MLTPLFLLTVLSGCPSASDNKADDTAPSGDSTPLEHDDGDGDGFSTEAGDCDDGDSEVSPEAPEVCDGLDNDCDGTIDEEGFLELYEDEDSDGYGAPSPWPTVSCEMLDGWVTNDDDCNDSDSGVNPSAAEDCDGVDNDCDGSADEDC